MFPPPPSPDSIQPTPAKANYGCPYAGIAALLIFLVVLFISFSFDGTGRHDVIHAKAADARMVMMPLVAGVMGYQTEYGHLPLPKAQIVSRTHIFRSEGPLLNVLLGHDDQGLNPRGIVYFTPPSAKNGANGFQVNAEGVPQLLDPWGHLYYILFDTAGKDSIPNPEPGGAAEISKPVIVFSAGPDGDPNTWVDNVASWK